MPLYITRGRFTADAVKGMLAKPEDREEVVAKLFQSVGGKLIGCQPALQLPEWLSANSPAQTPSIATSDIRMIRFSAMCGKTTLQRLTPAPNTSA
jgi:hypothetical protein